MANTVMNNMRSNDLATDIFNDIINDKVRENIKSTSFVLQLNDNMLIYIGIHFENQCLSCSLKMMKKNNANKSMIVCKNLEEDVYNLDYKYLCEEFLPENKD